MTGQYLHLEICHHYWIKTAATFFEHHTESIIVEADAARRIFSIFHLCTESKRNLHKLNDCRFFALTNLILSRTVRIGPTVDLFFSKAILISLHIYTYKIILVYKIFEKDSISSLTRHWAFIIRPIIRTVGFGTSLTREEWDWLKCVIFSRS